MANRFVYTFCRLSFLLHRPPSSLPRVVLQHSPVTPFYSLYPWKISLGFSPMSYSSVNVVLTEGTPKFVVQEAEIPKKEKWRTKKRLKMQRMREKRKRKLASKTDPRRLTIKGKKQRFPNAEARIICKIEKAKLKEAMLIEKLKKYDVPKLEGPTVEPVKLTGEECFYLKKMAQKQSNYVQVGRRGVFGGVILNMHLHWKKHETCKVICKPCKPGQILSYAEEIARLSGGIAIQIIGNDTIVFYRGKNYCQPEVMSPIDTLSKKKALEKSKYEQSLESVRRFIAISEKELELYYRHVALYGNPSCGDSLSRYVLQNNRNGRESLQCSNARTVKSMDDIRCGHSDKETDAEVEDS
ncbi:putative CRM domain-containing protein [Nymphaea thermarum]|nr:putative CRM domain-containing protein [Nymphaea thermarum]